MRLRMALGGIIVVSLVGVAADKSPVPTVPLNVKVGLWRMTYTTERNGIAVAHSVPAEILAKMTPDQRARTEARLKARAAQGSQIETRQYCLSDEKLKKAIFDNSESQSCQRTMVASTSRLAQFHDECAESGGTKRTEDGRFEALDFDTIKGLLKVKAEGSAPFTMNVEIAGKWIAADCGSEGQ